MALMERVACTRLFWGGNIRCWSDFGRKYLIKCGLSSDARGPCFERKKSFRTTELETGDFERQNDIVRLLPPVSPPQFDSAAATEKVKAAANTASTPVCTGWSDGCRTVSRTAVTSPSLVSCRCGSGHVGIGGPLVQCRDPAQTNTAVRMRRESSSSAEQDGGRERVNVA
ncbi:hypothetical protein L1887_55622 [Cichorium endivia]|nr:hypothetical protein L1887_55622 [Cichorium endivia]